MASLEDTRAAIERQKLHWEAGHTRVGHLIDSGKFRGFGLAPKGREPSGGRGGLYQGFAFGAGEPPSRVDWRDIGGKDYTTHVRDQKACGSCVAFATCAVLESRAKIKQQNAAYQIDLSEAHLFYCGTTNGCERGWAPGPALARCRDVGVGDEAAFPYEDTQQQCREIKPIIKVPRWRRHLDADERKRAIAARGPVIAGMTVYADFGWYRSGVYRPSTARTIGLHAVAVIGYDDGDGFWLIKNSWGTAWGEGGVARVGYGTCGIDYQFPFYDPEVELI